ncbi:double-strand break repair helicase AddA [Tianweitania sp. BSSL-BM11]|uniref:DNA 3'-5' helicase n=1 Tax=Tianweitania aestuarii TaxID=2814886 RepID=A0ABS5S173_9HYPH|nr:double-strand break repair helicase AddA [Tianweitania aestuarii]MBS9721677.1 double-strand break repair helicase AddA [Tianweitania aestuarii]
MSVRFVVPEDTLRDQTLASDPGNSVWVSAHAGSGKTHVLSQRVVRLLLSGTEPSRILCLTYTKAAAANMANRIFRDLGRWTMLDDAALAKEIADIEGSATAGTVKRARRLFAQALETPGGLKIQTIHAFCEALLHQFPLEANIAGHFELLEGQAATALLAQARRELLLGTRNEPDLADAFATVLQRGGESGLDRLLDEIVAKRDDLKAAITDLHGGDMLAEHGFGSDETAETLSEAIWPDSYFDASLAETIAQCASNKVRAADFAAGLSAVAKAEPPECFALLCKLFLTASGEPRKPGQIAAKEVVARFPDFAEEFTRMADGLVACRDRIALLDMLHATKAALTIADRLIGNYSRLKHAGGFLDFEDLIRRTIALLARSDAGPWVRYRLDQGIDHILVDEAQDTSPQQWMVIRALSGEFFVGDGARADAERTIFAVGDEKQSIYSFQGAEPESFDINRRDFKRHVEGAEKRFETVKLQRSFRSTWDVLSAVDRVFSTPERRRGLTQDGVAFEHKAIREEPGSVEAWPFVGATSIEEPDDWAEAIDHASAPAVLVAEEIATRVEGWLKTNTILPGKGRPIRPGDVMVLVRKRDSFIHALSRALKNRRIDVAGADRLSLPGHIAVQDLVALGRVVLQPEDDLSLAALLKSPIFGLDEDALFGLSHGRADGVSLYTSLRRRAGDDLILKAVLDQLTGWRNEAGFKPAFEFYAAVLGRDGIRQKMISRLGHEAGEILDEFLNFLLGAERAGPPDLESVLSLLDQSGPDIKREMDQTRNEIRIMTVHAAKGLEAPIVFLVDSGGEPFIAGHLPRLLAYETPDAARRKRFLWRAGKDLNNSFAGEIEAGLKDKAEDEYRRLLYVGMTRAEDQLIVCGYHGKRGPTNPTWLTMVREGLEGQAETTTNDLPDERGTVLHYQVTKQPVVLKDAAQTASEEAPAFPAYLRGKAPSAPRLPRPLAPSRAAALIETTTADAPTQRSPVLDPQLEPSFAIERGNAIHRLLQILPDMQPDARAAAAERYLGRVGAGWQPQERDAALRSVFAVLDDETFAPLFAPGSRAEVSVMGTLELGNTPRAIAGTIDRLAVMDEAVLILDYKTNRPPPADLDAVPDTYVLQLALYRALLADLYPQKRIEAALLFTEAPRLIALPAARMDAALQGLNAASTQRA